MSNNYREIRDKLKQANRSIIRCTISGTETLAYVYVEKSGSVYLFQNVADGAPPEVVHPNDYGYKYSWIFDGRVRNVEFVKRFNEEDMFKSLDELLK